MPELLRASWCRFIDGDTYNAELIDKSIDALTNAAGTKGYAFAEIHPRITRDRDKRTIDVIFNIDQGPRVYVEKINITGNTRTLDKVIRREFRLVEGDAFNRVLVDRSRTRIRALGFFKDVDIKTAQARQPDRTVLNVDVTEQSTGRTFAGRGLFLDKLVRRPVQLHRTQSVRPRPVSAVQRGIVVYQQGIPVQLHRALFP